MCIVLSCGDISAIVAENGGLGKFVPSKIHAPHLSVPIGFRSTASQADKRVSGNCFVSYSSHALFYRQSPKLDRCAISDSGFGGGS